MTCLSMKFYSFLFFFFGGGYCEGGSAEDDLELGILLPAPPKYWDERSIEGYTPVLCGAGNRTQESHVLGKHSTG